MHSVKCVKHILMHNYKHKKMIKELQSKIPRLNRPKGLHRLIFKLLGLIFKL